MNKLLRFGSGDGIQVTIANNKILFQNLTFFALTELDTFEVDISAIEKPGILSLDLYPSNRIILSRMENDEWFGDKAIYIVFEENEDIIVACKTTVNEAEGFDRIIDVDNRLENDFFNSSPLARARFRAWAIKNDKINMLKRDLSLDEAKTYKLFRLKSFIDGIFENGSFLSDALGIRVDCRRAGSKNDLQNAT